MTDKQDSKANPSPTDEERPKIKVTDRRLFDAKGNPRQLEVEAGADDNRAPSAAVNQPRAGAEPKEPAEEPQAYAAPPGPLPSPAEARSAEPPAVATATTEAPAQTAAESPSGEASFADLPRDFSAFVESQYVEALIFLGAIPHPQTGETIDDPAFARYKIDLLAMLQEKTKGNLTAEEDRLIQDVLYQLHMLYVQKTKTPDP